MAKHRYLNTRIWIDNYIYNLNTDEKLLFLYFITNPNTHICGIYEIMFNQIVLETRMKSQTIFNCLLKFEKDNKIVFRDNWIAIKNFAKHQKITKGNVLKGVENGLKESPKELVEWVTKDKVSLSKTLEDSLKDLNYLDLDFNLDLDLDINSDLNKAGKNADKSASCKMRANKKLWSKMPSSIKYFCKRFNHMCLNNDSFCMSQYNRIDKMKENEYKRKGLDRKGEGFFGAVINGIKDEIDHPDSVLNAEVKKFLNKPVKWLEEV
jgi:hypothetical protein